MPKNETDEFIGFCMNAEIAEVNRHIANLRSKVELGESILKHRPTPAAVAVVEPPEKVTKPRRKQADLKNLLGNGGDKKLLGDGGDDDLEEFKAKVNAKLQTLTSAEHEEVTDDMLNESGIVWGNRDAWKIGDWRNAWKVVGAKK